MSAYSQFTNRKCPRLYCGGTLYIEEGHLHCLSCAREWNLDGTEIDHTAVRVKQGKPNKRSHILESVLPKFNHHITDDEWSELAKIVESLRDRE